MNGTHLTLGLVGLAALAGAGRRGSRSRSEFDFAPFQPTPQGFSTSVKDFTRGYALDQVVSQADMPGIYHVTTNLPEVLKAGRLKSRKQLRGQDRKQVGLGGGFRDQSSHLVSVGVDFLGARRVFLATRMMARAVHGQISPKKALEQIKSFSTHALDEIDQKLEDLMQREDEDDDAYVEQVNEDLAAAGVRVLKSRTGPDLYGALAAWEGEVERLREELRSGWAEPSVCTSTVGFTEPAHKFERVRPENVGLLKLAARANAERDFIEDECEIRFRPEDLAIVAVWKPGKDDLR